MNVDSLITLLVLLYVVGFAYTAALFARVTQDLFVPSGKQVRAAMLCVLYSVFWPITLNEIFRKR